MSPQTYIFYGRSGSGKGTQAKLLGDLLSKKNRPWLYLETGERFRHFMHNGTFVGTLTKEAIGQGGLLPPFLPIWVWTEAFVNEFHGNEDLILDGLCRRASEAPILDSAMKFFKREKPYVILINASKEWSRGRLKSRGREDDGRLDVEQRLSWFDTDVVPALAFFQNNPDYHFVSINGEQSSEKVHADILVSLGSAI